MEKNQKVRVSPTAKHHAGKLGYFQFYGKDSSEGVAVLSESPTETTQSFALFAVGVDEIAAVKDAETMTLIGYVIRRQDGTYFSGWDAIGSYASGYPIYNSTPILIPSSQMESTFESLQKNDPVTVHPVYLDLDHQER